MGFDVSYHPVNVALIREQILLFSSPDTLGGYVPPEKVPALVEFLDRNRQALSAFKDGRNIIDCSISVKKIAEAAADAAHRKMGFLEASEIYSGPMGIMN